MYIFISYRRGAVDQPNAGRIYDYLRNLGYPCYYDQDEDASPTGGQFPAVILQALTACQVIIAVIGESWIKQANRLSDDESDWVRRELAHAHPQTQRQFIPIYIGTKPKQLPDKLPADLEFVRTANSHFMWEGFEAPQKEQLRGRLLRSFPARTPHKRPSDCPQLQLLCDRGPVLSIFDQVLQRRSDPGQAGGWLIFGEDDEGHADLFRRIDAFSLPNSPYQELYPGSMAIKLDLHGCHRDSLADMQERILRGAADHLKDGPVDSYTTLLGRLAKREASLALLYSVVGITTPREAHRWITRFHAIHADLPPLAAHGIQLIFALSLSYPRDERGLLGLLGKSRRVSRFFKRKYPELFRDDEHSDTTRQPIRQARLASVDKTNVSDWYHNINVYPSVQRIRESAFLEQFKEVRELPLGTVTDNLWAVIERHAASPARAGDLG